MVYHVLSCQDCVSIRFCFAAVDFFNEISLIWGIVCDVGIAKEAAGNGFPNGFEYRWSEGGRFKSPVSCSGPEYVEFVMNWVEKEINNESLFPTSAGNLTFVDCIDCTHTVIYFVQHLHFLGISYSL